jgi:4-oxalomesaconate hydratase
MGRRLLVVGAHSADFVWRAAGTIAVATSQGGSATVIALSYGELRESGALWKEPNQSVEKVKCITIKSPITSSDGEKKEHEVKRDD